MYIDFGYDKYNIVYTYTQSVLNQNSLFKDTCPLGDQPGEIVGSTTCATMSYLNCYGTGWPETCCAACESYYTGTRGKPLSLNSLQRTKLTISSDKHIPRPSTGQVQTVTQGAVAIKFEVADNAVRF